MRENILGDLILKNRKAKYVLRIDNLSYEEYKELAFAIESRNKLNNQKNPATISLMEKLIKSHETFNSY